MRHLLFIARGSSLFAVSLALFAASLALFAASLAMAAEPPVVLLWPNGAPGSEGKTGAETVRVQPSGEHASGNVHQPSISTA